MDLIAYFIFYNKATGPQARFAFHPDFKHCNVIVFDGSDWVMFEFEIGGYLVRRIKVRSPSSLFRTLKVLPNVISIVAVEIKERAKFHWRPFLVRSCNEICRYATGIDIGLTFNPIHLYIKLLKYRHKRNYNILAWWRRKDGFLRWRQRASK